MIRIKHILQQDILYKGKTTIALINKDMIECIRYSYDKNSHDILFMESGQLFYLDRKQTIKLEKELIDEHIR